MIVLDTNVLSEMMKPAPEPRVLAWFEAQSAPLLFTTAISRGEMLYGVHILPTGQRRTRMLREVEAIFSVDMAGRVLPYDSSAADAHAELAAERRANGKPIGQADAMIAGIARAQSAQLATRNVRDFDGCSVHLVNPWQ